MKNASGRLWRLRPSESYFNIEMANGVFRAANVWFSLAIVCVRAVPIGAANSRRH
jgi:hypothetical protein